MSFWDEVKRALRNRKARKIELQIAKVTAKRKKLLSEGARLTKKREDFLSS